MADKRRRNLKCADGVADKRSRIEIVCIRITGATGDYANTINGYYELMPDTTHHDSPVYHKMTDTGLWMVMLTSGNWGVQWTEDKEANNTMGFAFSLDHAGLTPNHAKRWRIRICAADDTLEEQASISVTGFSIEAWTIEKEAEHRRQMDMQHRAAAVAKVSAVVVSIAGAAGEHAHIINGDYSLVADVAHNHSPVYRNMTHPDMWLVRQLDKDWGVQRTENKEINNNTVRAYSLGSTGLTPDHSKRWEIDDGNKFEFQESVSVMAFSPAEWATKQVCGLLTHNAP